MPLLGDSVRASRASIDVNVDVIVVDNGADEKTRALLDDIDHIKVIKPETNVGFAAGCNIGVAQASGDYIALINPDAVVNPDAIKLLIDDVTENNSIATSSVVYYDNSEVLNAAGTEMHFLGVSWCRKIGEKQSQLKQREHILCASGAAMAMSKKTWDELGGFQESYFTYYEDAELSIRAAQQGIETHVVKDSIVRHDYVFSKNSHKMFHVDKNRMSLVYGSLERSTLISLLPAILVHEIGITAMSLIGGWFRERMRALQWVMRNRPFLKNYRRTIQDKRQLNDKDLFPLYAKKAVPPQTPGGGIISILQVPLTLYIRLIFALKQPSRSK
jgi:GT2 family glycosyltransferase